MHKGLDVIGIQVTDGQMFSEKGRNIGIRQYRERKGLGKGPILVGRRTQSQPKAF